MVVHPAVIVHGLADARVALAHGRPVTLLSAPGAALYAGCLWWQSVVRLARAEFAATAVTDILDCADGSGQAMAALRIGLTRLVLWPAAPGREAVTAIAVERGGFVLDTAPPALDLAHRGAARRLAAWLQGHRAEPEKGLTRDKHGGLG
jgi:hypothetical protein